MNNKIVLSHENTKIYRTMVTYINSHELNKKAYKEVLEDIKAMFWVAEQRNESADIVFGKDYKVFCDDFIKNLPRKNKYEILLKWISISASFYIYLILFQLISSHLLSGTAIGIKDLTIILQTDELIQSFILPGFIIIWVYSYQRYVFEYNWKRYLKTLLVYSIVYSIIFVILTCLFHGIFEIKILIVVPILFAIFILSIIGSKIIKSISNY